LEKTIEIPVTLRAQIDCTDWEMEPLGGDVRFKSCGFYRPRDLESSRSHDPEAMLDEFLGVDASDKNAVLSFLKKYGEFGGLLRPVTLSQFAAEQQKLARMRLRRSVFVPLTGLEFSIRWENGTPRLDLESRYCFQAMVAVVHIERAAGLRFGRCADPKCLRMFRRSTKHKSRFCPDRGCQHRALARRRAAAKRRDSR
jgi:hypothetical protein